MTIILKAEHLVKHFPSSGRTLRLPSGSRRDTPIVAVDDISLSIAAGTCFGLLGPNGAGKTTTVEMLEGIVEPTSGDISYRNGPLDDTFRQRCGIMFQSTALQDYMTVREALRMFRSFYLESLTEDELIDKCSLSAFVDRDTRKLSGGQRQRLLLAIALVNNPDVVFLDEPTTGLDPQARRQFWELVHNIKAQGKTVILTTHYMEEAMQLCDNLVFMGAGKIIAEGSPSGLLASHFDSTVLEVAAKPSDYPQLFTEVQTVSTPRQPPPQSTPKFDWQDITALDSGFTISTTDVDRSIAWLQENNISLAGLQVRSRTLEDLFLALTESTSTSDRTAAQA